MKKNTGFTLIELMVTLVIVGILVVVGGPMLTSTLQGGQLVASTNELVSAIHISRSEAVKLNRKVTICVSDDGATCLDSIDRALLDGWTVTRQCEHAGLSPEHGRGCDRVEPGDRLPAHRVARAGQPGAFPQ